MTKLYAQEKRVFDINKVTVVGNPTITSDGVASGFTTANYIASPTTLTINPNIFRICFEFTTSSDITTPQMIIRSKDGQNAFIIGLKSRKMRLYLNEGDSPLSWGVASDILSTKVLTANTKYSGCLSFNGSTYTLNLNNEDWITVKSSTLMRSSFALKIGQGMSAEPFLGSVDIQAIRVYSNNELVYSPTKPICYLERRKEGFDLSKFTVVGSPTITEAGVASGFNNNFADYISIAGIQAESLRNKSWEISASIIVPEDLKLQTNIFNIGKTYHYFGSVSVLKDAVCFFARTGTMSDTNNEGNKIRIGKSATVTHIGVKLEYVLSTGTYKLTAYDLQNNTKLGEGTWTAPSEGRTNTQLVGVNSGGEIIIGSVRDTNTYMGIGQIIDLTQFSITVDGKEVFTGAKEKFYAMRDM